MTKRAWTVSLLSGALVLLLAVPFAVVRCRIARSRAFCDAVQALPRSELDQFAARCDRLMRQRGGPEAGLELIDDTNILAQFALAGKSPYQIVLEKGTVGIKYIGGNWRYSTIAIWGEDYSSDGDRIRVLKITYGTYGWRILSQREGGHGEPGAPPNGGTAERSGNSGVGCGPPSVS